MFDLTGLSEVVRAVSQFTQEATVARHLLMFVAQIGTENLVDSRVACGVLS